MQADKTRQELIEARAALDEMAATLRGTHARKANLDGQVGLLTQLVCCEAPVTELLHHDHDVCSWLRPST